MLVRKENIKQESVSCNFCDKGELNQSKNGLVYPYSEVVSFSREGNGVRASICEECLIELNKKATAQFKAKKDSCPYCKKDLLKTSSDQIYCVCGYEK